MKTSLLIMCLTLLPLTAQNNAELKELTVGGKLNGLQFLPKVHVTAKDIQQNAGIVHLKGSVEITLVSYTLQADEAEYDQQSGEIHAHGDVLMKPTPSDPRGARQFGIK